jgi:hypothetical protein
MKEKKEKLKLEDIKVESFITSVDENAANRIMAGTAGDTVCASCDDVYCNTYPLTECGCSIGCSKGCSNLSGFVCC